MAQVSDELKAVHARIVAGELTKKEAAAVLGVTYTHLCVKLSRAGLIDSVRTARATAKFDSPAMTAAFEEALATPADRCNNAEILRKHGLPPEQYVAFSSRVLYARRSRIKADLRNAQTTDSGAATASG